MAVGQLQPDRLGAVAFGSTGGRRFRLVRRRSSLPGARMTYPFIPARAPPSGSNASKMRESRTVLNRPESGLGAEISAPRPCWIDGRISASIRTKRRKATLSWPVSSVWLDLARPRRIASCPQRRARSRKIVYRQATQRARAMPAPQKQNLSEEVTCRLCHFRASRFST